MLAIAALLPTLGYPASQPAAIPSDLESFLKTQPASGTRDRAFLDIPAPLAARLAIDSGALRSVDPGLVCDLSSKAPTLFQASLGRVGAIVTVCTPAGWSQGILTLENGSSYVTTCGDSGARVSANVDLTVGAHSLHGSIDSAPSAHSLSHACSGWTKVNH